MKRRLRKQYKLVEGRDDDLIAWLDSIPRGRREPTILEALRAYSAYMVRLERMERQLELVLAQLSELRNGVMQSAPLAPLESERDSAIAERRMHITETEW